jgi:hypothetical protein
MHFLIPIKHLINTLRQRPILFEIQRKFSFPIRNEMIIPILIGNETIEKVITDLADGFAHILEKYGLPGFFENSVGVTEIYRKNWREYAIFFRVY